MTLVRIQDRDYNMTLIRNSRRIDPRNKILFKMSVSAISSELTCKYDNGTCLV